MKIVTTSDCNFIGIPFCPPSFFGTELIDITIDWGDSQTETIRDTSASHIHTNADGAITVTHNYSTAGQYNIIITGGFGSGGPIKHPGELAFAQTSKHNPEGFAEDYNGRAPNSTVDKISKIILDRNGKTSVNENFRIHGQGDFKDFINLELLGNNLHIGHFLLSPTPSSKISKSTDGFFCLDQTFKNCKKLINSPDFQKVRPYDLKCTSMQSTFENSSYNSSKGISNFRGQLVINANSLFKNSEFNGSVKCLFAPKNNVLQNADNMFEGSKFNQPIQHWRFPKVESADSLFKNSQFNSSARSLFSYGNNALKNANSMFEGSNFNQSIEQWKFNKVESADSLFKNSEFNGSAKKLFESSANNLKDADNMFEGSKFNQPIQHWKFTKVESADSLFKNSEFNNEAKSLFGAQNNSLKDADSMFEGSKFSKNIEHWKFTKVETADSLFKDSEFNANARTLFSNKDNALKDADSMFEDSQFQQNIVGWKFGKVETANNLFAESIVSGEYISNLFTEGSSLVSGSGMFKGRATPKNAVDEWEIPAKIKEETIKDPTLWGSEETPWANEFITWDENTVLWTYNKSNPWAGVNVDWEDAG